MKHALAGLLLASALSAGFCAPPAWAEELGQVRFTFDDMENTWFTVIREIKGKSRPSATLSESSTMEKIEIEAFSDPEAPALESLTIRLIYARSITRPGPPDYTRPAGIDIVWALEGFVGPRWEGRNVRLDLTTIDLARDTGYLGGTFSAEFCHLEEIYGEPDEASCRPVSGSIDTKVVRKE